MNLGIGDAVAAAQAILNGTTESYGDKRHVAGTKILKMTEATRREICSNRIFDRVKFNVKMRLVQNISLLHPAFVRQLTRMP
jgi:2-polyprenyl-6-methoxyphenol hydroxylase-like FAD-dependent oxidoreductase